MESDRLIGIYILMVGPVLVGGPFALYDWLAQRQEDRRERQRRLL